MALEIDGEDLEQQPSRIEQWRMAIESEIRDITKNAAETHAKMVNSKTETKREYYHKKFQKFSTEINRLVGVLTVLEAKEKK